MSYLLDTWAWIEYFEGSNIGKEVDNALNSNKECYTSILSIAELSDNFYRKDAIDDYSWEEIRNFIITKSRVLDLTVDIASKAGETKSKEWRSNKGFGLADAIILETARKHELELITGDSDLINKERAIDLS